MMANFRRHSFQQNRSLFDLAPGFRIVEIGPMDAKRISDDLQTLRSFVVASEDMYPAIERWFKEKVVPGLRTTERLAFVAFEADRPIASAILKFGERSKFCHLRISQNFQDLDLGQMFFTQMTLEARRLEYLFVHMHLSIQ